MVGKHCAAPPKTLAAVLNFSAAYSYYHHRSNWTKIHETCVTTRTPRQITSHAQKIARVSEGNLYRPADHPNRLTAGCIQEAKERLITTYHEGDLPVPSPRKRRLQKIRSSAPLKKRAPRHTSCSPTQTEAHKNHVSRELESSTDFTSDDEEGDVDDSFRQTSLTSNANIVQLVSNVDEADDAPGESVAVSSPSQRPSSPEDWREMIATNFEMTKSSTPLPKSEDDFADSIHSEGKISPSLSSERVSESSDELLPEYTKPSDDESANTSDESVPQPSTRNTGNDLLTDAHGHPYDMNDLPPALPPSVAVIRARIMVDQAIYGRIVKGLSKPPDYNNKLEYTVSRTSRTPKPRESLMRVSAIWLLTFLHSTVSQLAQSFMRRSASTR